MKTSKTEKKPCLLSDVIKRRNLPIERYCFVWLQPIEHLFCSCDSWIGIFFWPGVHGLLRLRRYLLQPGMLSEELANQCNVLSFFNPPVVSICCFSYQSLSFPIALFCSLIVSSSYWSPKSCFKQRLPNV